MSSQQCAEPASRPSFLSEKTLESAVKHISRKFPHFDTKVNLDIPLNTL